VENKTIITYSLKFLDILKKYSNSYRVIFHWKLGGPAIRWVDLSNNGTHWVWGNGIVHPSTPMGQHGWFAGEPNDVSECASYRPNEITNSVTCTEEQSVACIMT